MKVDPKDIVPAGSVTKLSGKPLGSFSGTYQMPSRIRSLWLFVITANTKDKSVTTPLGVAIPWSEDQTPRDALDAWALEYVAQIEIGNQRSSENVETHLI